MKHYGFWCAAFLSLAIAPQALCQSERSGPEYAADQSQTDRADPPRFWSTFADDLKSGGKGPLMVGIDPGTFRMGCGSGFRCGDNVPVQDVAITRPFGMSVYEVTGSNFARPGHTTNFACPNRSRRSLVATDRTLTVYMTSEPMYPSGRRIAGAEDSLACRVTAQPEPPATAQSELCAISPSCSFPRPTNPGQE